MVGDGVDAGVVDQEVDFGAIERFACFGDELPDGVLRAGVAGEDVGGGGGDGFEIGQVGGRGADAGEDGVGVRLGELADKFEAEAAVGAWRWFSILREAIDLMLDSCAYR